VDAKWRAMDTGARLKQARDEAGYTQAEVAAFVGVSGAMINQIEKGRRKVPRDRIEAFAEFLNLADDLVAELRAQAVRVDPVAALTEEVAELRDRFDRLETLVERLLDSGDQ
jgi:transcriptional regulator with XRE-family HTH domain